MQISKMENTQPTILAIDTSCDETSVAVTQGTKIISNVIWSQAMEHAKFGGVMPSLAKRMHEERIDWAIQKALRQSKLLKHQILNSNNQTIPKNLIFQNSKQINAVAVTSGPGLAIALEVGIRKAKELAIELQIPLIEVNHIEGHLLSPLAETNSKLKHQITQIEFPALGLVVSGGHTELVYIEEMGKYKIISTTQDDALGEALDKAARMLGLGYPGGAFLEKLASEGDKKHYPLPLPMAGRENENKFSYSGLKTAMWRLVQKIGSDPSTSSGLSASQIKDFASGFQDMAFKHLIRVMKNSIENNNLQASDLLVGGGVSANLELRKRLRTLGKEFGMKVHFPINKKLCGDNAAMIGVAAGLRYSYHLPVFSCQSIDVVDRKPRWKVDDLGKGV